VKRSRGSLAGSLLIALVAAGTTWAATFSWRGFSETSSIYLGSLLVLGATVAVTGALARWWRLPGIVVVLLQVLVSGMLACAMLTGSPLPIGPAWVEMQAAFSDAVDSAQQYQAPVPETAAGIHPLLVAGGLGCLLLVDLLACTLRRVPLAGLPLLTVYSVPVSVLDGSISWWVFALTAGGFLAMLFLHENEQIGRWGRPLGQSVDGDDSFGVRTGAIKTSAGTIGGVATALAIVVPLAIPTLDLSVFDLGNGPGGDGEIKIENPMADLRRDLRRGPDVPLIRIQTDDPDPDHLRISALTRFSDNEWSSGDRDVPTANLPNGAMPALDGVAPSLTRQSHDYRVSINENFESTWLPTQAPISQIVADGDWRYDPRTMDFISSEDDLTTAGLDYAMTSVELDLDAAQLAQSPSAVTEEMLDYLSLPEDLPPLVRNLAESVTEDAATPFEKAQALQLWFREVGGFEYDLEEAPNGNGVDELEQFLDPNEGRVGYCEQFAAAMAVMARVIDIPARVAVGFLEPDRVGADTWEYSAHDLHAWTELYFSGFGWVLFEPTPADRVGADAPGYTTEDVPDVIDPTIDPSASSSDDLPDRTSEEPSASAPVEKDELAATAGDNGPTFPWLRVFGVLAALLVLAAVAITPGAWRRRLREHRLAGGAEEAWAELRATAVDLRLAWPRSRSPRQTRDWLVQQLGGHDDGLERPVRGPEQAPEAVEALDRLVLRLERMRYARHAGGDDVPAEEMVRVLEAMELGASPRVRRTARWWPRSVLHRDSRRRTAAATRSEPIGGGVVEHVGG
jgi:transglutaminase-like putative cysteine protease